VIEKPSEEMTAPEHWAVFFRYLKDKSKRGKINEILEQEEGIAMASQVLLSISKDEAERARLMSEFKGQMDYQSKIGYARREGRREGHREGHREGRREEQQEIARNLKADGLSIEQISKWTGLTEAQITEL
jgi:predicted transposase/invertase (TIGR01784 family)